MEGKRSNPLGHWEHLEVFEINCALLKIFGGDWKNPPAFPANWLDHPEVVVLEKRAREFVEKMNTAADVWAFKEPRTCLTLPFWKKIIPHMQYIIAVRDPFAVAESLMARNTLPIFRGMYLWAHYWLKIMHETKNEKRIFISYDAFLLDIDKQILRLIDGQYIHQKELTPTIRTQLQNFVQSDLQHHKQSGRTEIESNLDRLNDTDVLSNSLLHDLEIALETIHSDARDSLKKQKEKSTTQISALEKIIHVDRDRLDFLEQEKKEYTQQIIDLNKKIQKRDIQIRTMEQSHFWKMRNRYIQLKDRLHLR